MTTHLDWLGLWGVLKRRRARLRMTPTRLAAAIGRSERTIHRWEGGETSPDAEELFLWMRALGLGLEVISAGSAKSADKNVRQQDPAADSTEVQP